MYKYIIKGGKKLHGEVDVSGSKNASLPILAATIISGKTTKLYNVPDIQDVRITLQILKELEEENSKLTDEINEYAILNKDNQKYIDDLKFDITNLKISVSSFDESADSINEMLDRINLDIENTKTIINNKTEQRSTIVDENSELEEKIKKIKENKDIMECKYNEITVFNKIRLGIRNTFNIFSKFTLLFIVFLFMSIAFLTEYASFQLAENEADESGYSIGFRDISDNRILIKKQNQSAFTNEDYARIKGISNIDYIVEDDLFIDCSFSLNRDDMSFYGNILDIKNFRGNIDLGRKPNNDNEIILRIGRKHFYITNRIDEVLGKTFSIMNPSDNEQIKDLTIVGIQYSKDDNDYNPKFYAQSETLRELRRVYIIYDVVVFPLVPVIPIILTPLGISL